MLDLWWQEAEYHGVLPLDERGVELSEPLLTTRSTGPIAGYLPPPRVATERGGEGVLWVTGKGHLRRRISKSVGVAKHTIRHSQRHAFITNALDARVRLRHMHIATRHAAPHHDPL